MVITQVHMQPFTWIVTTTNQDKQLGVIDEFHTTHGIRYTTTKVIKGQAIRETFNSFTQAMEWLQ